VCVCVCVRVCVCVCVCVCVFVFLIKCSSKRHSLFAARSLVFSDAQTRTYNTVSDEPIAGNYFPASQRAILRDRDQSAQLTLVMTSSHGCGSFASGHIELMLHRRCLKDDGYGVGEVRWHGCWDLSPCV
jgi:hypothetical protein